MTVCQKLGVILESKVVQKLSLEIFFEKIRLVFDIKKLTLKVQFWHFLTNCNYL